MSRLYPGAPGGFSDETPEDYPKTYGLFVPNKNFPDPDDIKKGPKEAISGPISVTMDLYLPMPENAPGMPGYADSGPILYELAIKIIENLSLAGWLKDPAQVARLQISKFYRNAVQDPGVQVVVSSLD